MTSLLMLSDQAVVLRQLLDEHAEAHDGDITDVEAIIATWWDETVAPIETKVESCARLILEWRATEEARKAEADRLRRAAAADAARAERLKSYVKDCLTRAGIAKVKAGVYAVSVQRNGGVAPLELSVPAIELPPAYHVVTVDADKARLRADLEAGREVIGARLLDRGTSLRIR